MALNLVRNSKVFFTTNVNPADGTFSVTNTTSIGGFGTANTFEIQVLDGFSFSQNTNTETITINEAGNTPVRGQRSFNISLAPVDFSFSTYIRPRNATTKIVADESYLWNALLTSEPIREARRTVIGTGGTGTISSINYTPATSLVAITGTSLPSSAFLTGDTVVIAGLTATAGYSSHFINGYGIITGTPSSTNINVTITPAGTASATTITSTGTLSLTKHDIAQTIALGAGGTGSITSITYTPTVAGSMVGNLTIVGSGFPTTITASSATAVSVVSIGGITAGITGATVEQINQPAYVSSASATSIVLTLSNPPSSAVSFSSVTSVTVSEAAWLENGTAFSYIGSPASDRQKLQPFGLLLLVDNVIYALENCVLNQASIDFGLDAISTVTWTGQATTMRRLGVNSDTAGARNGDFSGTAVYGKYTTAASDASYLTNKLSTMALRSINQQVVSGVTAMTVGETYALALTGGNITINNNVTYLTPALLGTVNRPATYFTGTRSITGTVNAYLKTGSTDDAGVLLTDMLDVARVNPEVMMGLTININGATSPRVVLEMPSVVTTVPSVDVQQVVTTALNFTAEGSKPTGLNTSSVFDLQERDDLLIRYYA